MDVCCRRTVSEKPHRYPEAKLQEKEYAGCVKIYGVKGIKGGAKRISGYIDRRTIQAHTEAIDRYKIFFTTSYSTNAVIPPEPILAGPGEVCTETFLLIGPFESEKEQQNCYTYMTTKFFRFLLYYGKGTMQVNKAVFNTIPLVEFSKKWTDEELFSKFHLSLVEIDFIENLFT